MTYRTALILGCSGQDGSLLCQSLIKKRYRVIGLSKNKNQKTSNLQKLGIEKDIEFNVGDITDLKCIKRLIDVYSPEEIYNLAGQSSVGISFTKPILTIESIIKGTATILEACKETSYTGRIFFAGSGEMFGQTDQGANINHKKNPQSPYAIAKLTSFNLVKMYREIFSLKCMTGVLFNHESPLRSDIFVTQKIIKAAQEISKNKSGKLRMGNINVVRDWGWAPEYVEAMQIITNASHIADHVICTGKENSLKEFIKQVFSALELEWEKYIEIDQSLFRSNEILKSYGDPKPLFDQLGWKAEIDFKTMTKKMLSA